MKRTTYHFVENEGHEFEAKSKFVTGHLVRLCRRSFRFKFDLPKHVTEFDMVVSERPINNDSMKVEPYPLGGMLDSYANARLDDKPYRGVFMYVASQEMFDIAEDTKDGFFYVTVYVKE